MFELKLHACNSGEPIHGNGIRWVSIPAIHVIGLISQDSNPVQYLRSNGKEGHKQIH